jgi:nitrate/nitrite-specific signal transduction histidine kinase
LERLVEVNRNAMAAVDERAKRLGSAGAWSAVFIGALTFLLSLIVLARLERRFVQPLLELHEVLNATRQGHLLRRCRSNVDAPREVLNLTQTINRLLDERLAESRIIGAER